MLPKALTFEIHNRINMSREKITIFSRFQRRQLPPLLQWQLRHWLHSQSSMQGCIAQSHSWPYLQASLYLDSLSISPSLSSPSTFSLYLSLSLSLLRSLYPSHSHTLSLSDSFSLSLSLYLILSHSLSLSPYLFLFLSLTSAMVY